MNSFLEQTILKILEKFSFSDLANAIFLVPSHRAGQNIKHILQSQNKNNFFLPKIYVLSDFFYQWRFGEKKSNDIDLSLLMLLFQTHLELFPTHSIKNWESFYELGKIILQDFNEIDKYLLPIEKIFSMFGTDDFSETASYKNRQQNWSDLGLYYQDFQVKMNQNQVFYTGAWMRQLSKNPEQFQPFFSSDVLIFGVGFAALSAVEKKIINYLKTRYQSHFFYDLDVYFSEKGVGHFFKDHPEAQEQKSNILLQKKDFYLESISTENAVDLVLASIEKIPKSLQKRNKTAVFLADEKLLPLFLLYLPQGMACNVSAGLALTLTGAYHFFFFVWEQIVENLKIDLNFWRFWIQHPFLQSFKFSKKYQNSDFIAYIRENTENYPFFEHLTKSFLEKKILEKAKNYQIFIEKFASEIIVEKEKNSLLVLSAALKDLIQIHEKNNIFPFHSRLFTQLLKQKTAQLSRPILGNPQEGIQVLGVLESRALDFETLIFLNIEEKIFPADAYHFSFIPSFVRKHFELPGKKELQYLYGYYFYRLLIRAKKAYFLYNKTVGELGSSGELSRFVQQVFLELPQKNPAIQCVEKHIPLQNIKKQNEEIFQIDKEKAKEKLILYLKKGLSPTALVHWMDCPADFFATYVLRLSKKEEDPKNQMQLYLGDWVHKLLEAVYLPLKNTQALDFWKQHLQSCVDRDFLEKTLQVLLEKDQKTFEKQGVTALWQQIAMDMVSGFLQFQVQNLQYPPLLLGMELWEKTHLRNTDFVLEGKLDFLAAYENYHQIVDYKTAFIDKKKWKIPENLETLFDPEKKHPYQKYWIQLLFYALLYHKKNSKTPIAAGIFSLQQVSAGLLQMGDPHIISVDVLQNFENELWNFIESFLVGDRQFSHQSTSQYCHFCLEMN